MATQVANPFEALNRQAKALKLADALEAARVPYLLVRRFGREQWQMVSERAKVNPPSEATIALVLQRLATRAVEHDAAEYARLTGREVVSVSAEWATFRCADGVEVSFCLPALREETRIRRAHVRAGVSR